MGHESGTWVRILLLPPSFISHSTSGEVIGLSTQVEGIVTPMRYQLLSESKHGVGASLLTKNELGSIPSRTANYVGV